LIQFAPMSDEQPPFGEIIPINVRHPLVKIEEQLLVLSKTHPQWSRDIAHADFVIRKDAANFRSEYLRADGDFTWFKVQQKEIFASVSLKDFEENNTYPSLVRIHRSFMVNLARIDAVKGNMVEINKEDIPIGSIYRTAFLRTMGM